MTINMAHVFKLGHIVLCADNRTIEDWESAEHTTCFLPIVLHVQPPTDPLKEITLSAVYQANRHLRGTSCRPALSSTPCTKIKARTNAKRAPRSGHNHGKSGRLG